jgi:hypothetical protein
MTPRARQLRLELLAFGPVLMAVLAVFDGVAAVWGVVTGRR